MPIIYDMVAKTARMNAVLTTIGSAGKMELGTAEMATVLATINFANPAGTVANGVLTFTLPRSDASADNSGIAVAARIRTGTDVDVITGLTVGTLGSNADVIIDNSNISASQIVTVNSGTITHA